MRRYIVAAAAAAVAVVVVGWAAGCGFTGEGTFDVTTAPEAGVDALGPSVVEGGEVGDSAVAPDTSTPIPDAATDSALPPPSTVVLALGGAVVAPTGNAQQTHLVYAVHSARWWLFTIDDDTTSLRTYSSADFVTWTANTPLVLLHTHANEGANFSVAYADIGGADVVHIGFSHRKADDDLRHLHTRAVISGVAIAYGAQDEIEKVGDPLLLGADGCSTVITQDGHVMDLTGWAPYGGLPNSTGNACSYSGLNVELGTGWTPGFGTRKDIVAETRIINARIGLDMGGAEVVSLWEGAEVEPNPTSVQWARWNGTTWSTAGAVFAAAAPTAANDWSATRLSSGEVHAVRRTIAGAYQHRKLVGTTWSNGQTIPAMPGIANAGVVLLSLGPRMLLATIGADVNASVNVTTWNGTAWAAWSTVEGSLATRGALAGHASAAGGGSLIWSEQAVGATKVMGRRVIF